MHDVVPIVGLVIGVLAVSSLARLLHFPAPLLLVGGGFLVSLLPGVPTFQLDPELVLVVLLPPLLYAAALNSSLIDVWHNRRPIALLSVGLVLVTTLAVGATFGLVITGLPFAVAAALGAIVAPPDAVATSAVGRRSGLGRRALTVLEGESLFNDATALVALNLAVTAVSRRVTPLEAAGDFLLVGLGGVAVGLAVGQLLSLVRRRVHDSLTDTGVSLVAPFIAFIPAEELHVSGVIAVVVAGLLVAHRAPLEQEPRARLVENSTWAALQYLLEGAVFAIIGLELRVVFASLSASVGELIIGSVTVLAVVVVVRPLWIFGTAYLLRLALWADGDHPRPASLAVISWAGIRGVVSLAAALSLPLDFPRRDVILVITVAVIVGTLGVQGLSLPWVIRRLGVVPPDPRADDLQRAYAQERAAEAAVARLEELIAAENPPEEVADRLRRLASLRTWIAWERLGDLSAAEPPTATYRRLRREMIGAERAVFVELRDSGELDEEVLRQVQLELDLEETLLTEAQSQDRQPSPSLFESLFNRSGTPCEHLAAAPDPEDVDRPVCQDCVERGLRWVHLRQCTACGKVGCCDSSVGRHAEGHWRASHHPVMRSAEPRESWRWCYIDRRLG